MLVLAMEFSGAQGTRPALPDSGTGKLGHAHGRLWDSLEQALGLLPRPGGTSRLPVIDWSARLGEPGPTVTP